MSSSNQVSAGAAPTPNSRHSLRPLMVAVATMGLAGVAWLAWYLMIGDSRPPLILLVSIDTLRADALGSYGNAGVATPHLDSLAGDGVRFAQAFAQSPWTVPSHASMLASLYPTVSQASAKQALPPSTTTLPEVLRDMGYKTGGIVNVHYLTRTFGFDQGFDEFQAPLLRRGAPQAVDAALAFLQTHAGQPVFLFLHLFDVHGPYDAPRSDGDGRRSEHVPDANLQFLQNIHYHDYLDLDRFRSVAELRAAYDAGVERVDVELGRLFTELRRRGLYDEALIIVTADHGEAFFEHGLWVGHGLFLYDTELRIPIIVKLPKDRGPVGAVVETPVSLIDIMPTVLEVAGHASVSSAQGESLLAFVDAPVTDRNVLGYSTNTGNTEYVRSRRWKFVGPMRAQASTVMRQHLRADPSVAGELSKRITSGPQLFDLSTDPQEMNNVAAQHPEVVAAMEELLNDQRERNARHRKRYLGSATPVPLELNTGEREHLRQLGYE